MDNMKKFILALLVALFALSPVLPEAQAAAAQGPTHYKAYGVTIKKHRKRLHKRHVRRHHRAKRARRYATAIQRPLVVPRVQAAG